jgi:hypothetical protein
MPASIAEKMGISKGSHAYFMNAPDQVMETMDLPDLDLASELEGKFDYIHFFVKTQATFNDSFPKLKNHLKPTGMLWVSWPKSGKLGTDLRLTTVIKLGYDHDLVESKVVSINDTWSAIKFTYPKAGKVYKNSYGKLKSQNR